MNKFCQASRPEFKAFVDKICSVPSERPSQAVSASYATPIQILGRLPPTSREGFPSLPFLIDSAQSFASLISLWLQKRPDGLEAKFETDHALRRFHELCTEIQQRTKDCLSSAEPAERPTGGLAPQWERLLEERERCAALYREPLSRPLSPFANAVPGIPEPTFATKRHSDGFFTRPLSHPSVPQVNDEWPPHTSRSSSLVVENPNKPVHSRSRPHAARGSAVDSKNSSTLSLEATERSSVLPKPGSRDGSSRNRFKEFVSGSARRRMREGIQAPRPEERNDF
jgi:hypothetical protein